MCKCLRFENGKLNKVCDIRCNKIAFIWLVMDYILVMNREVCQRKENAREKLKLTFFRMFSFNYNSTNLDFDY